MSDAPKYKMVGETPAGSGAGIPNRALVYVSDVDIDLARMQLEIDLIDGVTSSRYVVAIANAEPRDETGVLESENSQSSASQPSVVQDETGGLTGAPSQRDYFNEVQALVDRLYDLTESYAQTQPHEPRDADLNSRDLSSHYPSRPTPASIMDDFDGTELDDGVTITFALEGAHYEISLGTANQQRLHDVLAPFIAKARTLSGRPLTKRTEPGDPGSHAIRRWARDQALRASRIGRS